MNGSLRNMPRYIRQTDAFGWQGADGPNGPWRSIAPPQSGTPWQTTNPMDDLRQASADVSGVEVLSPAAAPVPVSERLPGPEDCDKEGRCWLLTVEDEYPQWRLYSIKGAQPGGAMIWVPVGSSPGVMVDCFYTSHWLPAHALPLPAPEGGDVS